MKRSAGFIIVILFIFSFGFITKEETIPQLGIISRLEQDSLIYSSGFRMFGESVGRMLSPALSEEQFQQNIVRIKNARCKLFLCNIFFPGTIKIAGPDVDENRVLSYADTILSRAQKAGLSFIILGSGGSRRIPDGYDAQKAKNDFIQLCKKLALVANKYKIIIFEVSLIVAVACPERSKGSCNSIQHTPCILASVAIHFLIIKTLNPFGAKN